MKKFLALLMAFALICPACFAAEWPDGRSAAQPYEGVPEINLSETIGYMMLFPRDRTPADTFCDVLEMYLPREDLVRGEGTLTLYNQDGEIESVDFTDEEAVTIEPLSDAVCEALRWGGGTCISVHLITSLEFGESYYVMMDEGCFRTVEGDLASPAIQNNEAWIPVFEGEYGISGLYYAKGTDEPVVVEEPSNGGENALSEPEEEPEVTEAPTEAPEEEAEEERILVMDATAGDDITFDLKLGGLAQIAVIFSDNGSVTFDEVEYHESGTLHGKVTGDEINWGIVFLDESGNPVDTVLLGE